MSNEISVKVAVIGGGPGGYTAAFRAADLIQDSQQVALIEQHSALGGVCLNVGCIPSKSLLNLASQIRDLKNLENAGAQGLNLHPSFDLDQLRKYQNQSIQPLRSGLDFLAQKRKLLRITGLAQFLDANTLQVGQQKIRFEKCIIATGSVPSELPFLPKSSKVWDSTMALQLKWIPQELLIIGGGVIGVEMAQIYSAFGSHVTIMEVAPSLLSFVDHELVQPLLKSFQKEHITIETQSQIHHVTENAEGLVVEWTDRNGLIQKKQFHTILQAVGRKSVNASLGLEKIGIALTEKGLIPVNDQMQTHLPHLFAIGDCIGDPMLAHKASTQAKVAAENACGHPSFYRPACIPSVIYTSPEIAWVGLNEQQLKKNQTPYQKAVFPWSANGRAVATRSSEGLTVVLSDPKTQRILGAAITGMHAGDLISEFSLAIEMGARVSDLSLTIHPHPTYAETVAHTCELIDGTITELLPLKKST